MLNSIQHISNEKRKAILEASIEEFSLRGYRNASTNNIVKKAGTSKGILFHYFTNKKTLYLFVIDQLVCYFAEKCLESDYAQNSDVFERIIKWNEKILNIEYNDPVEFKFAVSILLNIPDDIMRELTSKYKDLYRRYYMYFIKDIDTSKFREGLDPNRVFVYISL